jgi:hypothetical protein
LFTFKPPLSHLKLVISDNLCLAPYHSIHGVCRVTVGRRALVLGGAQSSYVSILGITLWRGSNVSLLCLDPARTVISMNILFLDRPVSQLVQWVIISTMHHKCILPASHHRLYYIASSYLCGIAAKYLSCDVFLLSFHLRDSYCPLFCLPCNTFLASHPIASRVLWIDNVVSCLYPSHRSHNA